MEAVATTGDGPVGHLRVDSCKFSLCAVKSSSHPPPRTELNAKVVLLPHLHWFPKGHCYHRYLKMRWRKRPLSPAGSADMLFRRSIFFTSYPMPTPYRTTVLCLAPPPKFHLAGCERLRLYFGSAERG